MCGGVIMDYTIISQLIGSLGFPIVCCGYMMTTVNKTLKENTVATNKMVTLIEKMLERTDTHE